MVAKEELLVLKTKILPPGAYLVLDFLASRHQQAEWTQIVLENVPLLILGRHGMIARIPLNGVVQKVSQAKEIVDLLQSFFQTQDTLYIFVNLPELPLPAEVMQLLEEVQIRAQRKDALRRVIDDALDAKDKEAFILATSELRDLAHRETLEAEKYHRRHRFLTEKTHK